MVTQLIGRLRRAVARWIWPSIEDEAQAQLAASASARGFRAITDNLAAIISQFDPQGRFVFANKVVTRRLGRSNEGLLGLHLSEVVSPDVYALLELNFERALLGEQIAFDVSYPVNGVQRYFSGSYVPELDAAGKLTSVYGLWLDVTERKQVELRHAAGVQRLRTIADNLPILIAYVDHELRFEFCNATFTSWTGLRPEELLGRSLMDVVDVADARRAAVIKPNLQRALAGERVEFELEPTPGRADRWLQITFVPETDAAGAVAGIYLLSSDVTHLKQVQHKLAGIARFDELTGLPNRYHLNEKLEEATRRSSRSGHPMGVIFLDIDYFKQINDTLGHAAGDEVLREFGRRLRGCVRQTDTVARLGGDEFLIVLEDVGESAMLETVGAKILDAMHAPFNIASGVRQVSSSVGLAFGGGPRIIPADLLACADAALYEAKRAGRATYRLQHYPGTPAPAENVQT